MAAAQLSWEVTRLSLSPSKEGRACRSAVYLHVHRLAFAIRMLRASAERQYQSLMHRRYVLAAMQSRGCPAQAMSQLLCQHLTVMMSSSVVGELQIHAHPFVYQIQVTCKCLKRGS